MAFLDGRRYRLIRRGVPIHAYVGANGSGKTLAMVHDTLPSLDEGRRVISTVPLLNWRGDRRQRHPLWTPLTSWRQLVDDDLEHVDVLLDEVQGVASARSYATLPTQLANVLMQLRKRDIVVRWTSPNWSRADVILREVTQAVTVCKGWVRSEVATLPDGSMLTGKAARAAVRAEKLRTEATESAANELAGTKPQGLEPPAEGAPAPAPAAPRASLWPSRSLFYWKTYDAADWEEFTLQKVEHVKPICSGLYWRPKRPASEAYETLAGVETLDHLTEQGHCINCGGKRTAPKCSCKAAAPASIRDLEDQGDEHEHVYADLEGFSLEP